MWARLAIIDFDNAARGARSEDIGYVVLLWPNIGTDGPPAHEQARRIGVFCDAYGGHERVDVVDAFATAIARNIERLRTDRRLEDVSWWRA